MGNGLILVACLIPGTRMTSGPGLLPREPSLGLWSYRSWSIVDIHGPDCYKGHGDAWGLDHFCAGGCAAVGSMLILVTCAVI